MIRRTLFFLGTLLAWTQAGLAQTDTLLSHMLASERAQLPVEGELLYNPENLLGYQFNSAFGATRTFVEADSGLAFGQAFHLSVKRAGNNAWEPQLQSPSNKVPVNKGDHLLYVFYVRTTDTESPNDFGKTFFYIQRQSSPWTGLGSTNVALSTTWRKVYVLGYAEENFETGSMGCTFHLGFLQQDVEIGGILALNLGSDVDVDSLPTNDVVYGGMEADAAWREAAAQRIEEHRKSDISLEIRDAEGNVLEGAVVGMEMKRHAFGFGNFISELVVQGNADALKYQQYQLDMFGVATTPFYMGGNGDNWGWYGQPANQSTYPSMAQWLKDHGVPAKGHVLIWPGWQWMPSFFEDISGNPDILRDTIEAHLETVVPIGKEKDLYEWDVVNEPYVNHDVMDILGEEVLVDWFNKVHELDPKPRLIFNEYNILMGGGHAAYRDNFERLIETLLEQGAPLHGIGMQCHFDETLPSIPYVLETFDHYAGFGLPVQVTEFDVAIRDEQVQADYLRDFYTAAFSHPGVDKVVMWGFWEKVMWKPLGALVRSDWSHKPNYDVYMDLLYGQWWTPESSGQTDGQGGYSLRGFDGYYDIQVEIGDSLYVMEEVLIENDTLLRLDPEAFEPDLTSRSQGKELGQLRAWPNPCGDEFWIEWPHMQDEEQVLTLLHPDGRVAHQQVLEVPRHERGKACVKLDGLAPGLYFCTLSGGEAGAYHLRLIRQ